MTNERFEEIDQYIKRLSVALKAAKICVFEVDLTRQLYTFFENAEDIFGVSGDIILQDVQPYSKLDAYHYQKAVTAYFPHPDDEEVIKQAFNSINNGISTTYEARMRAGGSNFIWCKIDVTPVLENGKPAKMIGVITDITNIKKKADRLIKEARLDNFTGLLNKKYATHAIQQILSEDLDHQHALVLIDIDDFKNINDTYGHAQGDKIIKNTADIIREHFRKSDIVSRFGGDEFLVFLRDIPDTRWICEKLNQIISYYHPPIHTNSIGISVYPQDAMTFEELFLKADRALYHAKKDKGCYAFASCICK